MSELTPIEIAWAAREDRFLARDLIANIVTDFQEFHGDRAQGDDPAVIGGVGMLGEQPVTMIAINRGDEIAEKLQTRNGSPEASGYRKALRLMQQANKFNRPIITLINTPGAFPGKTAEEGGVGQAIAESIVQSISFTVPMIAIIYGEGGSGGALALATANQVWMFEHSIYAMLSPEGFASIMFKDAKRAPEAADLLGLTPQELLAKNIVERVILEGNNRSLFYANLRRDLLRAIDELFQLGPEAIKVQRQMRFDKY